MIVFVCVDNDIRENDELLTQFYPNTMSETNELLSNSNTPLIKITEKNSNILDLINRLDLEVI